MLMKKLLFGLSIIMILSLAVTGCGGEQTDSEDEDDTDSEDEDDDENGDDDGGGGDFAGTWTYVELLDSSAPTESLCPCGDPDNPGIDSDDPDDCGPREYPITFDVDSSGNVTIQGTDDSWGTIEESGQWSGSPEAEGYINGAVSGTCTSTSCSGTFTADYVTDSGGAADCYDGTFTMTKN